MTRTSDPVGRPWPLPLVFLALVLAGAVVFGSFGAFLMFKYPRSAGDLMPSAAPSLAPTAAGRGVSLQPLVEGLERPLALAFTGGADATIFVAQQTGVVSLVEGGELQSEPTLDLSSVTLLGGELGMLGIALHPDFTSNGLMYVSYVHTDEATILAEYTLPDRRQADMASARELIRLPQESAYHKGGALLFGPRDAYLYMSVGDDAWPTGDTPDYTDDFRGTILRIDVNRRDGDRPYGIPADNPFVDGDAPEVYDYGLRNPWRISIDSATGDLYIADVGSERYEEVSRHRADVPAPLDFGWGAWEGLECRRHQIRAELNCDDWADAEPPILVIEGGEFQSGDCAIIGGYVYRGEAVPALDSKYVFGDYCSGRLRTVPTEPERPNPEIMLDTDVRMGSFGMDLDGELYVLDVDVGVIYRMVAE